MDNVVSHDYDYYFIHLLLPEFYCAYCSAAPMTISQRAYTHSVSTYVNVLRVSWIQNLVQEKIGYEISYNNAKYTKYIVCALIATLKETFTETAFHHHEVLRLQIFDFTVRKILCFLGETSFTSWNFILDTQTRPYFSSVTSFVGGDWLRGHSLPKCAVDLRAWFDWKTHALTFSGP